MAFDFNFTEPFAPMFLLNAGVRLIITVLAGVALLSVSFGVVCYVFRSLGLYKIAKRRRIHHAWLSWIPVGSEWILGSIADQYQYVVKNRICSRRKILLGLYAGVAALGLLQTAAGVMAALGVGSRLAGPGVAVSFLGLAALAVSVTAAVFRYIALYDLFTSCDPDSRVAFLVLSIVFHFLESFFLFADRNRENGMPPRTDDLPHDIPGEPEENPAEFL